MKTILFEVRVKLNVVLSGNKWPEVNAVRGGVNSSRRYRVITSFRPPLPFWLWSVLVGSRPGLLS